MRIRVICAYGLLCSGVWCVPNASALDIDRDGMPDQWEIRHHLNPFHNDAQGNPDRDRLRNIREFRARTRPHDADTDNDFLLDGDEVHTFGTDPLRKDSDKDGELDANEDSNLDGLANEDEDDTGILALRPHRNRDTDNDQLTDEDEDDGGCVVGDSDSDDDGIIDGLDSDCAPGSAISTSSSSSVSSSSVSSSSVSSSDSSSSESSSSESSSSSSEASNKSDSSSPMPQAP